MFSLPNILVPGGRPESQRERTHAYAETYLNNALALETE